MAVFGGWHVTMEAGMERTDDGTTFIVLLLNGSAFFPG